MENNLAALSNKELINQLEKLVAHEKKTTADIVRHLSEVEDRKLHLELGYSSMFDYATRGLGYSNTGAARRIRVARAGAKVPEIFHYLAKEEVSLSALDACSGVLVKEGGAQVLETLKGMSREEAEWLSAFHNPVSSSSLKDRIQKVVVGSASTPQTDLFLDGLPNKSNHYRSGSNSEEKFKISFSVGAEFMEKLLRAQELMFEGKAEDNLLENIFGEALELYIEKHCPKEKQKRREAREAKKEIQDGIEVTPAVNIEECAVIKEPTHSRYIPAAVRDKVLLKDNYQCSYVSLNGTRCSCRRDLEIDHIIPFARGGKAEIQNLRVLCASHNLHAARQVFGAEFIGRKISGA
jgi:hypothetical protein